MPALHVLAFSARSARSARSFSRSSRISPLRSAFAVRHVRAALFELRRNGGRVLLVCRRAYPPALRRFHAIRKISSCHAKCRFLSHRDELQRASAVLAVTRYRLQKDGRSGPRASRLSDASAGRGSGSTGAGLREWGAGGTCRGSHARGSTRRSSLATRSVCDAVPERRALSDSPL